MAYFDDLLPKTPLCHRFVRCETEFLNTRRTIICMRTRPGDHIPRNRPIVLADYIASAYARATTGASRRHGKRVALQENGGSIDVTSFPTRAF